MDNSSTVSAPNQGSLDPQQMTQQIASSYVDDYMPPVNNQGAPEAAAPVVPQVVPPQPEPTMQPEPTQPEVQPEKSFEEPVQAAMPTLPGPDDLPKADEKKEEPESELVVETPAPLMKAEEPMPPMVTEPVKAEVKMEEKKEEAKEEKKDTQDLEDQNVFHLLGIESATDKEKDMFLDELQQIIWEDFLDNDVDLLLTEDELAEFKKIEEKTGSDEDAKQTEMVEYLEKLIPDLEKIMLEKAMELKEAMFVERMTQMKHNFEENPEALTQIEKAEQLLKNEQWRDSANTLNAIAH